MKQDADRLRIHDLEADNRRLRRLLEAGGAPNELRHRLRNTMALLRHIIRQTSDQDGDVQSYAAHLQDCFDAIVRAQSAIDIFGWVDLETVISQELLLYHVEEGRCIVTSSPEVHFQPRSGQIFALAIHELVAHSITQGAFGGTEGEVRLAWQISDLDEAQILTFRWEEQMPGKNLRLLPSAFGKDVLTGLLSHELAARTTITSEGSHFRCLITVPLTDKVVQASEV